MNRAADKIFDQAYFPDEEKQIFLYPSCRLAATGAANAYRDLLAVNSWYAACNRVSFFSWYTLVALDSPLLTYRAAN